MVNDLDYADIKFLVFKKDYCRIEQKNKICINAFCHENNLFYPVYVSDKNFEVWMDLLLITGENKWHSVYMKDLNRFMFNKTKNKN